MMHVLMSQLSGVCCQNRMVQYNNIALEFCTMVQWYNGAMVQWHNGTMVQWCNGTRAQLVQWCSATPSSSSSVPRCRVSPICRRFLQGTQKKAWRHFHNRDADGDDDDDGDGGDDGDDDGDGDE